MLVIFYYDVMLNFTYKNCFLILFDYIGHFMYIICLLVNFVEINFPSEVWVTVNPGRLLVW